MPSKRPTKSVTPKATPDGKPNALQKPLQPSPDLAAVVGSAPLPRGAVVSKVWDYIKAHKLQNPGKRREIVADAKLRKGVWQGQGDHVRDEQTPGAAPDLTALHRAG